MPETIDWPLEPRAPRRRRGLFFIIAALAILFFGSRTLLTAYVDLLWFRSLGYAEVFWKTLDLEWGVFGAFAIATLAIVYGTFRMLGRAHQGHLPSGHTILISGQPLKLSVEPVIRIGGIVASLLISGVTGATMMAEWPTFALWRYLPTTTTDVVDPIFGKPLNFYLFTLPALNLIWGWLLAMAVITCLLSSLFILASGGFRALNRQGSYISLPWRGLSICATFLMLVLAARTYLGRFDRLFERHTIFEGVSYTDAHVTLPGMLVIIAALILGALINLFNAVNSSKSSKFRWIALSLIPAAISYIALGLVGWYVNNFVVKPNELVRETPYISHNIEMTQQAYRLNKFSRHEFPAETTVDATDPTNNQPTLQNIRLWDWHALQDTLRQIQEIRTYYDFPDIDIDRYEIEGKTSEVMLATRELNVDKLPESSRNWINDKLIYTHGYGITMNPVNGFTPEGLPTLILSNMPVQSTVKGIAVKRPEIYFGELTNNDVYVKTHQQEFNYPQGQTNSLTSYEGAGGIELGSFFRRCIIAFARGDLGKLPFSDDVTHDSRLLMRRNVRDRVSALAPFLTYDRDPYMVVGKDGRLNWVMDAFTVSDQYPYSSHYRLDDDSINYLRNSVKAVVDAYDGTTTFYTFDNEDPIAAAYRNVFPGLFKDASSMPNDLRKHMRYPELLLKLQAEVYGLYHMTNPEVFYNREDLWTLATEVGMSDGGEQTTQAMQPNFVQMKLPGESGEEFVGILPFTPANRNNLIGWIAGRSDGKNYGTAVVYDFPKTKLVDGPLQIEARIDQNAQLSGQLTLWNQQGSHVRRGNLLVIPVGKALLYAEPIYLQAERSPMPELRIVVLALQDRLAYGATFEAALASLYGGSPSSLTAAPDLPRASSPAVQGDAQPADSPKFLSSEAGKDFSDYQRLTAEGKLGDAGRKLEELKHILDRLRTLSK